MNLTWVACSIQEFGEHVGRYRHLVVETQHPYRYMLTTQCGHSASVPGIWRRNSTKPECARCRELHPTA